MQQDNDSRRAFTPPRLCSWLGCETPTASGLCQFHKNQRYNNANHGGSRLRRLTVDEILDIERSMVAFESPISIAKRLGITTNTVHRVMKRRRERLARS